MSSDIEKAEATIAELERKRAGAAGVAAQHRKRGWIGGLYSTAAGELCSAVAERRGRGVFSDEHGRAAILLARARV
jgi:hypothetical protein